MRARIRRYLHVLHRFMDKGTQQPYGAKAKPLPPPFSLIPLCSPSSVVRCFLLCLSLSLSLGVSFIQVLSHPLDTLIRHVRFNSLMDLCSLITSVCLVPTYPTFHTARCTHAYVRTRMFIRHNQNLHISPLSGTSI